MGGYTAGLALNTPDFNAWLQTAWGSGASYEVVCAAFYGASNFVFGQNPPYYLDDLKAVYPKFFGLSTALTAATEQGSAVVAVAGTSGLDYGQFVQAWGLFPKGTVIVGLGATTVTLNNAALATDATASLSVYASPPIPAGVAQMYVNLAHASLVQARWQEMWWQAMGLFAAHYLTLYAKTDASEVFTLAQQNADIAAFSGAAVPTGAMIAAQGLAGGILTSKSVGDVSAGYSVLTALEDWGAWNLTTYGQLLATQARVIGSGPALIW